jgi:hypothetical protein
LAFSFYKRDRIYWIFMIENFMLSLMKDIKPHPSSREAGAISLIEL